MKRWRRSAKARAIKWILGGDRKKEKGREAGSGRVRYEGFLWCGKSKQARQGRGRRADWLAHWVDDGSGEDEVRDVVVQ